MLLAAVVWLLSVESNDSVCTAISCSVVPFIEALLISTTAFAFILSFGNPICDQSAPCILLLQFTLSARHQF
eukprot:m.206540 g.206540  ORF g.206540 m.206540 type:complete len:72 (-) comp53895_c0_seq21:100-315(-)